MPQPNDAQERDQGQRNNGARRMSATGDTIAMMRPDKAAFAARLSIEAPVSSGTRPSRRRLGYKTMRSAFFVAALASILAFPAASVRAADHLSDKAEASSPQGQTPSGIQAAPEGRPRRPSNPQREIAGT
jgi:hypothetical protein